MLSDIDTPMDGVRVDTEIKGTAPNPVVAKSSPHYSTGQILRKI
jgi:hypothetical protein